ncbi:MAG: hypothetical protein ACE5JX_13100 [Acidobacteriota bacterium]
MKQLYLAMLVFYANVVVCSAASDWTGLWRLTRFHQGRVDGTYHLFISDEVKNRITVYPDNARPMVLQRSRIGDKTLEFQVGSSNIRTIPLLFKVTRQGDRLWGEWVFAHFQYQLSGSVTGFRVMALSRWNPWEHLDRWRGQPLIDIGGFLLENAPLDDFAKFDAFCLREVEPVYYFLVQKWLYGDGTDPLTTRKQQLRRLFDLLKRPEEGRQLIRRFPDQAAKALLKMRELRLGRAIGPFLVSSFGQGLSTTALFWTRPATPQDEAECECKMDLSETFVSFNAAAFMVYSNLAPVFMQKEVLRAALWSEGRVAPAVEAFRQGLALSIALEGEAVTLPPVETEILEKHRAGLREKLLLRPAERSERFRSSKGPDQMLDSVVELDFVRALLERRPVHELWRLKEKEVMEQWRKYLDQDARKSHVSQLELDRATIAMMSGLQ